jgi:hypothetical protein
MKQKYMKPITETVMIQVQNMIAGSQPEVSFDASGETSTMDSRSGYDLWDDEDF